MARTTNNGSIKPVPKPKKVKTTTPSFVVTPEERKRFGVAPTGGLDARTIQAIKDDREAEKIASGWGLPSKNPPAAPKPATGVGTGGGAGGGTSAGSGTSSTSNAMAKLLEQYTKQSLGNIGSDLSAQQTQIATLGQQAKTRYDDYLAKLRAAQTAAQGQITNAQNALLSSIPQTAQAAPVVFQQPTASSNVYSNYLTSLGMSAPEVASMQAYNSTQAQAANDLAQQSAIAQQAAQQQYLDNLRSTANMAGAAANQRLAAQIPAYEIGALKTYGETQGNIADLLAKANTGAATSRQNTLDALLPVLMQNPTAVKNVLAQFGVQTPASPTVAKTNKPKKSKVSGKKPPKGKGGK